MTRVLFLLFFFLSAPAGAQEALHDLAQETVLANNAEVDEAPAPSVAAELDPCVKQPELASVEDLFKGTAGSVFGILLAIELLRYTIKPLRRRKGVPLAEWKRGILVGLGLFFGQVLAFADVAPALRPGETAKVLSGVVVTSIAILFNETLWKWTRSYFEKKFGKEAVAKLPSDLK